jgi:hypothetical protein
MSNYKLGLIQIPPAAVKETCTKVLSVIYARRIQVIKFMIDEYIFRNASILPWRRKKQAATPYVERVSQVIELLATHNLETGKKEGVSFFTFAITVSSLSKAKWIMSGLEYDAIDLIRAVDSTESTNPLLIDIKKWGDLAVVETDIEHSTPIEMVAQIERSIGRENLMKITSRLALPDDYVDTVFPAIDD